MESNNGIVGEGRIGPDPQINGGGAIVFRPELLNLWWSRW